MLTVNIEFTKPTRKAKPFPILSYIIKLVEQTEYSHVRLSWVNSTGIPVVYEASGHNIKFVGPIADHESVIVIKSYRLSLTPEQYRGLIKLCMTYAGLDYGLKQLLGIFLVKLFKLKRNPLSRGTRSQVCSEVVGRFLEEVMGYNTGLDLDIAGPRDIEQYLKQANKEICY